MAELNEQRVLEIMREEWGRRILRLEKAVKAFMDTPEGEKFIFKPGNKVKHVGSKLLYTIVAVQPDRVMVKAADSPHAFPLSPQDFDGPDAEYAIQHDLDGLEDEE